MPSLFREENFKIIVDPEIKLIPEFYALVKRDKTSDKRTSFSELVYIYWMYDLRSPYSIYEEKDRSVRVAREAGLDSGWKPDKAIIKAAEKYIELSQSPSTLSLRSTREALLTSARVVDRLREKIENDLKTLSGDTPEEGASSVSDMVSSVNSLLKLTEQLPKAISTIEDLEEKVKKELAINRKIKGGGGANSFED